MDDAIRNLIAGSFIDFHHSRSGYIHLRCTLLVSVLFQINQAYRFILFPVYVENIVELI